MNLAERLAGLSRDKLFSAWNLNAQYIQTEHRKVDNLTASEFCVAI